MTETTPQHPWAKFYTERGLTRPPLADLARRSAGKVRTNTAGARAVPTADTRPAISPELAAAIAAVTAQNTIAGSTAMPFITAWQKEAVTREMKRRSRLRLARIALAAVAGVVALHLAVTRVIYPAPTEAALQARVQPLPERVLPLVSSARQPMQIEKVAITQSDAIGTNHRRYVASVTLRLSKPLYVAAATNGTEAYRRAQEAVYRASEQRLRNNLVAGADAPKQPLLPLLLQRSHQAGEAIVVRVPIHARRFGWQWRIEEPAVALHTVNRTLEGDSLDRYAATPHLIFGGVGTLAEIRQRVKLANEYVLAVTREIQRYANVEAVAPDSAVPASAGPIQDRVADSPAVAGLADQPAVAFLPADRARPMVPVEERPAFDPNAPAVVLPELASRVALSAEPAR